MKLAFVGILLLLLLHSSFAILANDAELTVSKNNFLNQNEQAFVFNDIPFTYSGTKYWVVSIEENQSLKAFIAVRDSDSNIEIKQTVLVPLFKAAYIFRSIQERNPSSSWLISLTNSNRFQEFSNLLKNESFDLDIVLSEDISSEMNGEVVELNNSLVDITNKLDAISDEIKQLNDIESGLFNVEVDAVVMNELNTAYSEVFEDLYDLQDLSITYDGEVSKLKNLISKSDADSATKTQLIALVNPLNEGSTLNSTFGSYVSTASQSEEFLNEIYQQALVQSEGYVGEFLKRLEKAHAINELYGLDEKFKKDTKFSSLKDAVDEILAEQNKPYWNDQKNVQSLESDWKNAVKEFDNQQFLSAIELAKKAKADAVSIIKQGYTIPEQAGSDFSEVAVQLILGAVVVIVAVFAFQKRKKILSFIHPEAQDQESYNSSYFKK